MNLITYSDARKHLKAVMDTAIHDRQETVITRAGQEAVVVVSKDEWDSIQATLHLLSSPRNAARLHEAIAELDAGAGVERALSEGP